MTQPREQVPSRPELRDTDSIRPEEYDRYYYVPGWRIWRRNIFDALSEKYREREAAIALVEAKPMALAVRTDGKGYYYIDNKYDEIAGLHIPLLFKGPGVTDRPWYLLDPLTEEEVRRIDEHGEAPGPLGSTDKPHELLRPADLKTILEEKRGRPTTGFFGVYGEPPPPRRHRPRK